MKKILSKLFVSVFTLSTFAATSGMMLRSNSPSLKKQTEKGMEWAVQIPYGTKLDVTSKSTVTADYYWDNGKKKQENIEFYAVKYQGKEYFAKKDELAVGDKFAVISENATLFTNPKPSAFRNAFLETGTLVLLTGNTTNFSGTKFSEIEFYDTNEAILKTRWIQTKKYSDKEKDIKAAQLIELANFEKDEGIKKEHISNALDLAVSDGIKEYAQKKYDKIFGIADESESTVASELEITSFSDDEIVPANFTSIIFTEDGANVNVRNAPGTAGEKITQLANGVPVAISLETTREDTFEGITEKWYFVTTPGADSVSGWIFGGYLAK